MKKSTFGKNWERDYENFYKHNPYERFPKINKRLKKFVFVIFWLTIFFSLENLLLAALLEEINPVLFILGFVILFLGAGIITEKFYPEKEKPKDPFKIKRRKK